VNQTQVAAINNMVLSPTMGLTKGFLKKRLQTNARMSYNQIFNPVGDNSAVVNLGLGATFQINSLHTLSFNNTFLNRFAATDLPGFSEWYGQLMYNYRFAKNLRLSGQPPATPNKENTSNQ
jgi:hypothetical protein